jgi:redox-sensitive bicupin YhaK (pirin superfamily)
VQVAPGLTRMPLRAEFEHAVIALDGPLLVGAPGRDRSVAEPRTATAPGQIAALGTGHDELEVEAREPVRLMLLGGTPFPEPVFMWWNFVARSADEVSGFYADWRDRDARFGEVPSPLDRIPAPTPPWEPIRSTHPW